MPIRIMHVVDSLGKGGLENGLVNLINRMDPVRFEHVVCTLRSLGPNADRLPRDRVRIQCLAKQKDSRFQSALLARAIRQTEPDIVHSRNWAAIEAVIAGRWVRAGAVVHSEHGLDSNAQGKEPWRRVCFRRLAFELAHRVLSVSNQLRDFHAGNTGFAARRITVIHNGVDSRHFFPDPHRRASVRRELGLGEGEFCIGCVGSLFPIKDHRTLLQAIAQAAGKLNNWRLLLAGDGPELPNLQAFVESHPEWRTPGFLPGDQRPGSRLAERHGRVCAAIRLRGDFELSSGGHGERTGVRRYCDRRKSGSGRGWAIGALVPRCGRGQISGAVVSARGTTGVTRPPRRRGSPARARGVFDRLDGPEV